MIASLTLHAVACLMAFSGLPGLKGLPFFGGKHRAEARAIAAADTLPPPWKTASRLALESQFVRAGMPAIGLDWGIRLQSAYDPRKLTVSVDPDSGVIESRVEIGDVKLGGLREPLSDYSSQTMGEAFAKAWRQRSTQSLNSLGSNTPVAHAGLQLPIPVHLPERVQSILGPGGPALNVSGSESVRLSGTSDWTNQQVTLLGQKRSLFPSLDMQQDLNIQLEGQLSDRIKVNLLQNSANQIPLANRIAINYRGDEDDLVQEFDLGNTSLSLPGTQYVSYSGRNEGLFGVKMSSRLGPLDWTTLASKQEGRSERSSYTGGGGSRQTQRLADLDWVKGQYFLLYDPNFGIYDVPDSSIHLYLDDANAGNDRNVLAGLAKIDPDHAFGLPIPGAADSAAVPGSFDLLLPGADQQYEILHDVYATDQFTVPVIRLKQPIPFNSNQVLAVRYTAIPVGANGVRGAPIQVGGRLLDPAGPDSGRVLLKLLRVPRNLQAHTVDLSAYDTTGVFETVRELELKNFYQLSGFGIDPKTFKLTIERGQSDPAVTTVTTPDGQSVPYIEVLGLDNFDETTGQPVAGKHDGVVDGSGANSHIRLFVDYQNGVLWFPDPRPFAPRLSGGRPFDQFVNSLLNRRVRLDGPADSLNAPNPGAYEKYTPQSYDAQYYIDADFSSSRGGGDITLGRGNILQGSEAVVVNGERWTRDRDYTIDYDLGRVTLKRQLGPTDQLSIDYSYAPLFQQASRTLIGSAFRLEGLDRHLGGAFLYQSQGAQDLRPRLGEEPSRTLITDLNTEWKFKPSFLTRLADALPGVRTTTPSDLDVQAELGASFPNPNTLNEVYVDDMEGVRDAVSLVLSPEHWRWSGVPLRATSVIDGRAITTRSFYGDLPGQWNAEVHWYSPPNSVKEQDLRPDLIRTDPAGAKNPRLVLAMTVPRHPTSDSTGTDTTWAGLTYNLDPVGIDLSRSQFIEIWVNDFHDHHAGAWEPRMRGGGTPARPGVKLHIDLGGVSEDQMRAPNRPPNGRLDTEDQGANKDNQLTVSGSVNEDTGYDGLLDDQENADSLADLTTASRSDPEGDDFGNTIDKLGGHTLRDDDPRRYTFTNGTEGDKNIFPFPETEDTNNNGLLDKQEDYFEYTIDLGDPASPYLQTDVSKAFGSDPNADIRVVADSTVNGWRRYRIPISDSLRVQFGSPDLTLARHVRVWMEDLLATDDENATDHRPLLEIGGFDIVGSRWQATALTPAQSESLHTTLTLNTVNNVDNADIYQPPFNPPTTHNGSQPVKQREQSLALEFTELAPQDTLEAFKTFSLSEDYSRYGVLRWFWTGFRISDDYDPVRDSTLFAFVRFSSDLQGDNYYEVKRRVPMVAATGGYSWQEEKAELKAISNLKLNADFPRSGTILYRALLPGTADSVIINGRPSFTRIYRISAGVINQDATTRTFHSGQLWFDELRATDVAKDVGYANRLLVNGHVADLADYNLAWNTRDADFLSVGESHGSGSRTSSLAFTSHFEPSKFIQGTGIALPVNYTQNVSSSQPRFTAGDDVVRTGAQSVLSETRSVSRTLAVSYSRVWSERSSKLLRYTLGGFGASWSRSTFDSRSPLSVANGSSINASVNYNIAPRSLLSIRMPFGSSRLFPLPDRAYWNYNVNTSQSAAFTRGTDGSDQLLPASQTRGRAASIDFGADTRPFDFISHHIAGRRNLTLDNAKLDQIGFINLGRVVSWGQTLASHYALNAGQWLRPAFSWSSNYNQNNEVQTPGLGVRGISNGQDLTMNWDLPFDRIAAVAPHPGGPAGGGRAAPDTGAVRVGTGGPGGWRGLLSRLGAVSTDAHIGRTSGYSRISGTASGLYLFGLSENPGFGDGRTRAEAGNTSNTGLEWRTNARTRVPLVFGSGVQARFGYGDQTGNANGIVTRKRDWRFPDFDVDYGQVADALHLSRWLQNTQLRTAYSRSYEVDYQNGRDSKIGNQVSDDFRPLISVRGRLKNGTDANLSIERRSTRRDQFQLGNSTATDANTDLNFSLSRSYSQGQKVSFLGKTTTVRSNVSLQLTSVYSVHKGATQVGYSSQLLNPIDETRLSLNGTGSYGFSNNVTGDLAIGFSSNHDRTKDIVRRSVRVELRGQFKF